MARAPSLVIRVDADERIGTGHAMRCLALAQAWRDRGGAVRLLSHRMAEGIHERYLAEDAATEHDMPAFADSAETLERIDAQPSDWLAIDGEAGADLLRALRARRRRTLYIDDDARLPRYDCDVVLNQNLLARSELYEGRTGARLLLGPKYLLLRRELRRVRRAGGRPDVSRNLLVLAGGADPGGVSLKLIGALRLMAAAGERTTARVIVGAANPQADLIAEQAALAGVEVLADVRDMAAQFAWCDVAITAAGSTVWELAFHGVPMVVGAQVEGEVATGASLAERKVAVFVGRFADLGAAQIAEHIGALFADADLRRRLAARAAELTDGKGAERVVDALLHRDVDGQS